VIFAPYSGMIRRFSNPCGPLSWMQKLLTYPLSLATLLLAGCSWLNHIPFVYKPEIDQGNIIEQESVDQLRPGMTKTQVRFVMGTSMLIDIFHQDRWDYVYLSNRGGGKPAQTKLSLFFDDNRLVRIEGDLRPLEQVPGITAPEKETVVSVPDDSGPDEGIVTETLKKIGIGND